MINVVIVEDDYRIGNIHEQFLQKVDGFQVVGKALNGKDAIELMKGPRRVDLLLLDIFMPDILGTEVMHDIRKANTKVDVIVISAATETEIIEDVIRLGAFDYIIKPVKVDRFIQTLTQYKKMKTNLENEREVDQDFLDNYFGFASTRDNSESNTPKGIDPITLEKTKEIIFQTSEGLTAVEVGELIGVSRSTARRYLEYLTTTKKVNAELGYGTIGRPGRYYYPTNRDHFPNAHENI